MESTFSRHLNFIKEKTIIDLKSIVEYKASTIASILNILTNFFLTFFFVFVFNNFMGTSTQWNINSVTFFILFSYVINGIFGTLAFSRRLSKQILLGDFNTYLTRPINIFVYYNFTNYRIRRFFMGVLFLVFLIIFLLVNNLFFSKFFLVLLFGFFGGVLLIQVYTIADSFSFFIYKSSFLREIVSAFNDIFLKFPVSFFPFLSSSFFIFIIPSVFIGSFTTDFYFGITSFEIFMEQFKILIYVVIFFSLILFIQWKIGLKKYEAFG